MEVLSTSIIEKGLVEARAEHQRRLDMVAGQFDVAPFEQCLADEYGVILEGNSFRISDWDKYTIFKMRFGI